VSFASVEVEETASELKDSDVGEDSLSSSNKTRGFIASKPSLEESVGEFVQLNQI